LCGHGAEGDTRGYQGAATWSYKQALRAGRAATILQRGRYPIEVLAARIMQDKCTRCGTCAKRCPYGAIV
ncbi:MAG: 4Fe-4S binding protein, partial [Candidatus Thorarchaeota archaeon]